MTSISGTHQSPWDYSHDEVIHLENTLKELRNTEGKESVNYIRLKELVKEVRMANLPLRSYEMWKRNSSEFKEGSFKGQYPHDKATRKSVKMEMLEKASNKTVQERLKLLSRLTFIHGSSSATLAMLLHSPEPQLECSGALFPRNVVPMTGELIWGIEEGGINLRAISTETIRDIPRILGYTKPRPFDPTVYEYLTRPYCQLGLSSLRGLSSLIGVLNEWKEKNPEEYALHLSPGKAKMERLVEAVKRQIGFLEKMIGEKPRDPDSISRRMNVSNLYIFLDELIRGTNFTQPECNQKELPNVLNDMLIAFKESPFTLLCKERDWKSVAIKIIRMKQWDRRLFDKIITLNLHEWEQAVQYEYDTQRKPLLTLKAIIDHPFREDEITFIRNHAAGLGSSASKVPPSLRSVFPTLQDIPENRDPFRIFAGGTLARNMSQYRRGEVRWNAALWGVLESRINGENLTRFHGVIDRELQSIDRVCGFLKSALNDELQGITISHDETIRSLFSQPFPIVFASTTVKPKPINDYPRPSEYILETPTKLGMGGCDILFTDTAESCERIRAVLPESLREEIEIRLIEEFEVGDIPLTHHPKQVW